MYLACFTLKSSIGFDVLSANIASGGRRSGVFFKSNLPPFSCSGDLTLMVSLFMTTSTPKIFKISIIFSSPWGRSPLVISNVKSSPSNTADESSKARLEKSAGTVIVAGLYFCGVIWYFLYEVMVSTFAPNFSITLIVASR